MTVVQDGRLAVSRETLAALEAYIGLLEKWNPTINLVAKGSVADAWSRHVLDSAQILDLALPDAGHWVDLGAGGGFPGLVAACIARETAPGLRFTLIESDARKCAFLGTVNSALGLGATILHDRIERAAPQSADVVSARALAPLPALVRLAVRHMRPEGVAIFPKGTGYRAELDEARKTWDFKFQEHNSATQSGAVILQLREISRV